MGRSQKLKKTRRERNQACFSVDPDFRVDFAVPIGEAHPNYLQNINPLNYPRYDSVQDFFSASHEDDFLLDSWMGLVVSKFVPEEVCFPKIITASMMGLFNTAVKENLEGFQDVTVNSTLFGRGVIFPFIVAWLEKFASKYWADLFMALIKHVQTMRHNSDFDVSVQQGVDFPYDFPCYLYATDKLIRVEMTLKPPPQQVLDEAPERKQRSKGQHSSPIPHRRRGHWRRVAVGKGRRDREWRWIGGTIVNEN